MHYSGEFCFIYIYKAPYISSLTSCTNIVHHNLSCLCTRTSLIHYMPFKSLVECFTQEAKICGVCQTSRPTPREESFAGIVHTSSRFHFVTRLPVWLDSFYGSALLAEQLSLHFVDRLLSAALIILENCEALQLLELLEI